MKNILILVGVLVLSYLTSIYTGNLYARFFGPSSFFDINLTSADGILVSYIFFLPLLFTVFGDKSKYQWISILLIIPALMYLTGDIAHIYFPIALGILGWLIGWGILKVKELAIRKS